MDTKDKVFLILASCFYGRKKRDGSREAYWDVPAHFYASTKCKTPSEAEHLASLFPADLGMVQHECDVNLSISFVGRTSSPTATDDLRRFLALAKIAWTHCGDRMPYYLTSELFFEAVHKAENLCQPQPPIPMITADLVPVREALGPIAQYA